MKIRSRVRATLDSLGLRSAVERGLLEAGLVGERFQRLLRGYPEPSETILLAGSGRSGTTWLSDLLATIPGTQPIFEPLRQAARWQPALAMAVRSPYLRPEGEYPAWNDLLYRVLTGRCRSYWTDPRRASFLPRRLVIKEIRANLMLGYVHDHFRPRIVYLLRHPCAVVASRIRLGWRIDLGDLLRQPELVEDHLSRWVPEMERARTDPVASHAIWWAVESRVAGLQLATRRHFRSYYERLVLSPRESVGEMLAWLGLEGSSVGEERFRRSSHTTWGGNGAGEREASIQRLSGWKHQLSGAEQRLVLEWASRLEVMHYGEDLVPAGG